jgi:hypothetical protein
MEDAATESDDDDDAVRNASPDAAPPIPLERAVATPFGQASPTAAATDMQVDAVHDGEPIAAR